MNAVEELVSFAACYKVIHHFPASLHGIYNKILEIYICLLANL